MKSKVIVITGSIATGKSLVSSYLKENGYMLLDADKIAHDLMQAGQKNYNNIVEYFGKEILDSNKNIDNKPSRENKEIEDNKNKDTIDEENIPCQNKENPLLWLLDKIIKFIVKLFRRKK